MVVGGTETISVIVVADFEYTILVTQIICGTSQPSSVSYSILQFLSSKSGVIDTS